MEANQLYEELEKDFIKSDYTEEEWIGRDWMSDISEYLSDNFKQRQMGLVCDFADEINKIYTAVFPSDKVLQEILDEGAENAMLLVHHPSVWDIRNAPKIFHSMNPELLKQFKERRISIYALHVPLDDFGEYSTGATLVKALGVTPEKPFAPYFGSLSGIFARTETKSVQELKEKFEKAVGHEVKLYPYGSDEIQNGMIAAIGGGGNQIDMLQQIIDEGINTFVTGVTLKNDFSSKSHQFAQENKLNILGGTHYSTEKFACIALVDYFASKELESRFVEDVPLMEDM